MAHMKLFFPPLTYKQVLYFVCWLNHKLPQYKVLEFQFTIQNSQLFFPIPMITYFEDHVILVKVYYNILRLNYPIKYNFQNYISTLFSHSIGFHQRNPTNDYIFSNKYWTTIIVDNKFVQQH